jgi:mono/diheme cytochrome c family protein/glucose/arabinose dehydrogenase
MTHPISTTAAVLVAVTVAGSAAFQAGTQWPPPLTPLSAAAPVRTPADELKTIVMPPGYRLELVASEPLVEDPVVIDWDADGRLWVVEMAGYMNDIQATNEHEPLGRVVVLQDTDGDGRMDKRTVFADGLVLPRALKVLDDGVLVGEPPHLWFMRDTNHDLKADTKTLVTDDYGRLDANVEHNANTLLWALDNWIYTSEVDTFLRLKNGKFEVGKTLARGQWGAAQDDAGRVYRNTNESALHVDLVPTSYYARNRALTRTRGSDEFLGRAPDDLNEVWPIHPTPGVNRGYQSGILRADGTLAHFTSVCAPTVYRGDRLPRDLYGNVFVAEPAANLVSRIVLSDDGTTLRGRKAYPKGEFIASTDERFRPVYLSSAPDGTLYVVDLYRGVVQHKGFITEYLRDQILSRSLEQPLAHGRIWRVVHDTTRRGPAPSLSRATTQALIDTLSHPNGWWRDTSQQLLVQRHDPAAVAPLKRLAATAREPHLMLQALWTLDGFDAIDQATVLAALADRSPDVRLSAVRLAERWLASDNAVRAAVLGHVDDPHWEVREQVAASLGELPADLRVDAIAAVLASNGNDPVVVDAAVSGVSGREASVIDVLARAQDDTANRRAAVTMLTATIVSRAKDADIQHIFDLAADASRPSWLRSSLLRGAEAPLLGIDPLTGRGRGAPAPPAEAPCPTCPGGRGGPGGAPAFPTGRAGAGGRGAAPAGRGRGAGRPALKLEREPALVGLAAQNDELSIRARDLLARLEWPGKPGVAAVTPLTAAEQARFDAGKIVYQNLCQACHQPDGRGRDKLGAPLVGSAFALAGDPTIAARIVLNGKEGPIGLMPPLGNALSDDQIASVLTYVRREWGHTASAVDPSSIAAMRKATADRTRPWTNEELTALVGGR